MGMNHGTNRVRTWAFFGISIVAIIVVLGIFADNHLKHVEAAYIDFVNNYDCLYQDNMQFALGYINDDEIPELMITYGDSHVDQVYVYSFNPESGVVEEWGGYSSFAIFDYYERQGVVVAQYGGSGFWYHIYIQIGAPESKNVLAVESSYYAEDGEHYYWQSPCSLSMDRLENELDFDSIEVTEEKYAEEMNDLLANYTNKVTVGTGNAMTPYTEESLHAAFQDLKQ